MRGCCTRFALKSLLQLCELSLLEPRLLLLLGELRGQGPALSLGGLEQRLQFGNGRLLLLTRGRRRCQLTLQLGEDLAESFFRKLKVTRRNQTAAADPN